MTIQVMMRQVYGKEMIYPVCDQAKAFALLAKKITLDRRDLKLIESLGFTIAVVNSLTL